MSTTQVLPRHKIIENLIAILNENQLELWTDITEDTDIVEKFPDMDDLDRVEIVMEIENEFNIEISDEEVGESGGGEDDDYGYRYKLRTIKDWTDFIESKIKLTFSDEDWFTLRHAQSFGCQGV